MLHIEVNGTPLLLPQNAGASVEYKNPKLSDGIEDDYSLPVDLPVEGNEIALGHVHQAHLRNRTLELRPAHLAHQGTTLHPGALQVLGSTPSSVRASFSAQGFAGLLKGVKLRKALAGNSIDTVATHGGLLAHAKAVSMGSTPPESHCFPLHLNKDLYGGNNPQWQPSTSAYSATQAYAVDALVLWPEFTPVRRDWPYQCIEPTGTTAGQSPASHPAKWRRVVFGVVNSYDADAGSYDGNDASGNYYALVPWFRYDWVVRTALLHLGLDARGDWFRDHATPSLLLPNATPLDAEARSNYFQVEQTDPVTYSDIDDQLRIPAQDESSGSNMDPSGVWDPATGLFETSVPGIWRFRVNVSVDYPGSEYLYGVKLVRASDYQTIATSTDFEPWDGVNPNQGTVVLQHEIDGILLNEPLFFMPSTGGFETMRPVTIRNSSIQGWLRGAAYENGFRKVIDPADHVPDIALGDFLEAVATTFGLEVVPDLDRNAVEFNIKERLLRSNQPQNSTERNRHQRTTDISQRLAGVVDMDHQRRLKGLNMSWQLKDAVAEEPTNSLLRAPVDLETQVLPPGGPEEHTYVRSTRKLYRSMYDLLADTYVWQHQGYLIPKRSVGDADEGNQLQPPIKPLLMEDLWVDGRRLLAPVLNQGGRSSFFATDGDSNDLHVCHYYGPRPAGDDDALYPAAGSWGMDAKGQARWGMLLDDATDGVYPSFWDHYHSRWWQAMVSAVPITTDLLVDHEFIRERQTRNDLLHMHGHDHLLEALPMEYSNSRGPLVSRGAYLRRLVPPPFGAVAPKVYVPPVVTPCSGYAQSLQFEITDNIDGSAYLQLYIRSAACLAVSVDGGPYVIHEGDEFDVDLVQLYLDGLVPGSYCIYPCDGSGAPAGYYDQFILSGVEIQDLVAHEPLYGVNYFFLQATRSLVEEFKAPTFSDQTLLEIDMKGISSFDLRDMGANVITVKLLQSTPVCSNVMLPAVNNISELGLYGLALPMTVVDAAINVLDPTILGASRIVKITGGTSSAPGPDSAATRAAMTAERWTQSYNP